MKIVAHIEKFGRFEQARALFDPLDDFELWYWCLLSGGTALINAALHRAGITRESDRFVTQVPDVYAVPESGGARFEIAFGEDIIHVGLPEIDTPLPAELQAAFREMEFIERYRDPCVRGDYPITRELVDSIDAAYRRCVDAARGVLDGPGAQQ